MRNMVLLRFQILVVGSLVVGFHFLRFAAFELGEHSYPREEFSSTTKSMRESGQGVELEKDAASHTLNATNTGKPGFSPFPWPFCYVTR